MISLLVNAFQELLIRWVKVQVLNKIGDIMRKIDKESLQRIRIVNDKQISWFIGVNGYAACRTIVNDKDSVLTLHQFITNHYGHGKGQSSVDHINRNKLDNRSANLRITTQSVQNENRDKVKRHKTAKNLPDEIKDEILPKFVVYYKEKISKDTYREFFTVEGHPLQKQKNDNIVNDQTNQLNSRRWAITTPCASRARSPGR